MNIQVLDARSDARGGYKVDVSRGEQIGRVSSNGSPGQRTSAICLCPSWRIRSRPGRPQPDACRVESALIHVEANRRDPERLA
jgi:predicted anti-sigma-YlaC factor YlaD